MTSDPQAEAKPNVRKVHATRVELMRLVCAGCVVLWHRPSRKTDGVGIGGGYVQFFVEVPKWMRL